MGNEIFFFFLSYRNHSTFLLPLMTNIRLSRIVRTQEIFFFFRNDTKECKRVKYYGREYIRIVQFNVNFLFDKG